MYLEKELAELVFGYLTKAETVFQQKIREQLCDVSVETDKGSIKIYSFRAPARLNFNLSSLVLHELLSGEDYPISGTAFQSIMQDDGNNNSSSSKELEIVFSDTIVKYNREQNIFEINEEINITYTIVHNQ